MKIKTKTVPVRVDKHRKIKLAAFKAGKTVFDYLDGIIEFWFTKKKGE